jgi:hypothetical protein
MIKFDGSLVRACLIVAMSITVSFSFVSSAVAADCGGATSKCIRVSAGKPDSVARCTAAGESCQKTGVFVGPYSGTSYTEKKSGGCGTYTRNRACY